VSPPADTNRVREDPARAFRVIIVRLWWEQAGGGDLSMRARVSGAAGDSLPESSRVASTADAILEAVRAEIELFMAGAGGGRG
jgi:hypothetical protein